MLILKQEQYKELSKIDKIFFWKVKEKENKQLDWRASRVCWPTFDTCCFDVAFPLKVIRNSNKNIWLIRDK